MVQPSVKYPAIIMCYKRVDELKKVVNSLLRLDVSKIYFHLHSSPDEQYKVKEVLYYINSIDFPKEVIYIDKPLGCRKSFFSALSYISKREDKFYFIEDDILINGDIDLINKEMNSFEGILKFGERSDYQGIFWGWALTKKAANTILNCDFMNLTYKESFFLWENKMHYIGAMELFRRNKVQAWDDEVGMIIKLYNIPTAIIGEHTKHIGEISSRVNGIPDGELKGNNYVTYVNGELIN